MKTASQLVKIAHHTRSKAFKGENFMTPTINTKKGSIKLS